MSLRNRIFNLGNRYSIGSVASRQRVIKCVPIPQIASGYLKPSFHTSEGRASFEARRLPCALATFTARNGCRARAASGPGHESAAGPAPCWRENQPGSEWRGVGTAEGKLLTVRSQSGESTPETEGHRKATPHRCCWLHRARRTIRVSISERNPAVSKVAPQCPRRLLCCATHRERRPCSTKKALQLQHTIHRAK